MRTIVRIVVVTALLAVCAPSSATVTRYINRTVWQSAIGDDTQITFQGFPEHTLITDQYADLGVLFTDRHDFIRYNDSFLNDGVGLGSTDLIYGTIHMSFAEPLYAIASDFLGIIDIQLFSDGRMIYGSDPFDDSQSRFGGLISTVPFDAVVIRDPSNGVVVIDDLYFGPPIPAPGALAAFAVVALLQRRRRRND
jgi:MYXO-CTERM domain-containing protein